MNPRPSLTPLHPDTQARCANERAGKRRHAPARFMAHGKTRRALCTTCKDAWVSLHKHVDTLAEVSP